MGIHKLKKYGYPVKSRIDPGVQELLLEKNWSVVKDHTEQTTGLATPVMKVRTRNGLALLRFSIEEAQLQAYKNLENSKVAPKLIEHGMKEGARWALVEWIEGRSFDIATMSERELKVCTLEIITSATELYVSAAPESEESERLDQAAKDQETFEKVLLLGKSGPPIVQIYKRFWEQPKALHGDLVWTNAIRTSNGVMFIDPRESYGPIEKDLTWMVSIVASKIVREGYPQEGLSVARDYIRSIRERVQFLTDESLRAWTSLGLVYIAYLELDAGTSLPLCQDIARVGGLLYQE